MPRFAEVCSKRNFIRKAQDNGWVTEQDETALSALYDAASKEEPDGMKADLIDDAVADIFTNDVHDPQARKDAVSRIMDRLLEALFGSKLRDKVSKLDQGELSKQDMQDNYARIYGQRSEAALKDLQESQPQADPLEGFPKEWKQVLKNPAAMERKRREVFEWIREFKEDVAKNGEYTKGNPYGIELRDGRLVATKKLPWRDITHKELVEKEIELGNLTPEKEPTVRKQKAKSSPQREMADEMDPENRIPVLKNEKVLTKNRGPMLPAGPGM